MVITTMLRNIKDTGYPLRVQVWSLFTPNVVQLGFSDFAMAASTYLTLPLHRAIRASNGWLRWSRGGIVVQSLFQLIWLIFWVAYVYV
jgi:sterol O-acyltransferase